MQSILRPLRTSPSCRPLPSDYSTSDKLTVEVLPAPPSGDAEALVRAVVTATIVPGKVGGPAGLKPRQAGLASLVLLP